MSTIDADILCNNMLLAALPQADQLSLAPLMTPLSVQPGDILHDVGDDVVHACFPCDHTLVAMEIEARAGGRVEAALIGREGAVGGIISHGHLPAYARAEVQLGGDILRISLEDLESAMSTQPALREWLARYGDCLMAQVLQSAACNAVHSIEQRAAKWLVTAVERTGANVLPFTQDRLARMLGVGRSFVNRVLQKYKADGLIESRRGALVVHDVARLATYACSCDARVKAHFEEVLESAEA